MGVMACDRVGCKNIMCDRYSHKYGYICNDCFMEMKDSLIHPALFMNQGKKDSIDEELRKAKEEYLEREFPIKTMEQL